MKNLLIQTGSELVLLFLCTQLVFFPAWSWAKPIHKNLIAPQAGTLPVLVPNQNGSGWSAAEDQTNHYLQVNQTDPKVVIKWQSFDIGSNAHTHFQQPQNATALNRIYDNSPSQIYGQLTATGNVYLVNQNGVLFGKNSRVNLNSLVASSLNIKDEEFINASNPDAERPWHFSADNYMNDSRYQAPGDVSNQGNLTSTGEGRIFLLGGNVENSGSIDAEGGHVILSAGGEFEFVQEKGATGDLQETLTTDYSGEVVNTVDGKILADVGRVGIYGKLVQHEGLIRSLSTVRKGSSIELVASERVTTARGSLIDSGTQELDEDLVVSSPFSGREMKISKPEDDSQGTTWDPILIEHYGNITYPSGDLKMDAGDGGRIYLGSGSGIDVSGSWETKNAQDLVMSAQLNSMELRDEHQQKDGILKGETIYFLLNQGSSIGNVSEHLANRVMTAKEQSAAGGSISLMAGKGDIIIDSGAKIDISGGGVEYLGGTIKTTKMVFDGEIWDISDAPDYLTYEKIINPSDEISDLFDEEISGHVEGADAGTLELVAKRVAFEGSLQAGSTRGRYQVNTSNPVDSLGYLKAVGTTIPLDGELIVQDSLAGATYKDVDPVVDSIVIKGATPGLGSGFDPRTSPFPASRNGQTWLSDDLLSTSGLGRVTLGATNQVFTEAGTQISLAPGGTLTMTARRILHKGAISVASGDVTLKLISNKTSDGGNGNLGPERIELASGSSISTAGEKIDNHHTYFTGRFEEYKEFGQLDGGTITLLDQTNTGEGVVVRKGASIDVSGGYMIDYKIGEGRSLTSAGDAGEVKMVGSAIALQGELQGHSMIGKDGGKITLHAWDTQVVHNGAPETAEGYSSEEEMPTAYQYRLVMDDDIFSDTGFTRITLSAYNDLDIQNNVSLAPSAYKQAMGTDGSVIETILPDSHAAYIGTSSITLKAGDIEDFPDALYYVKGPNYEGSGMSTVKIGKNTSFSVAPGGSISINGDGAEISGVFRAPAGSISIHTRSILESLPLLIREDARFYANGYNREAGYVAQTGEIIWAPENGGTVSFGSKGTLIMEPGSVVDVSGSEPVTLFRTADNEDKEFYLAASEPGSVSLSFLRSANASGSSLINASFIGNKRLDYLRGAKFSLTNENGLTVYELPENLMKQVQRNGFEELVLDTPGGIAFSGSQTIKMARGIQITAPTIQAGPGAVVTLDTDWLQLDNESVPMTNEADTGDSILRVDAKFIDIKGDIAAIGFSDISLSARNDIRLTDRSYSFGEAFSGWSGEFTTPGNLTLTAARIYPTTASTFAFKSGESLNVLPSGTDPDDQIYSALGKLILQAKHINHQGYLAAPMGEITLIADTDEGSVYLADNSVLTVAGKLSVNYGAVDKNNLQWYAADKASSGSEIVLVDAEQEKRVTILGNEIIGQDEAEINIEGGGSIFGYTFLGSINGSIEPLWSSNRYVIIPASVGNLPGEAVFLEENDVVPQGWYTLLPDAYAFLEGAVVIEYQGGLDPTTVLRNSIENFDTAIGYRGDKASQTMSAEAGVYTLRRASDALAEANWEVKELKSGNGGSLTVIGTETNVFSSRVLASPSSGNYRGGIMNLVGKEVIVGSSNTPQLASMTGKLYLNANTVSQSGLWKLNIGVREEDLSEDLLEIFGQAGLALENGVIAADTITLQSGTLLKNQQVSLIAKNDITLGQGAGVSAEGASALADVYSIDGTVRLSQDAYIRSDNFIRLEAQALERSGAIDRANNIDRRGAIVADKAVQISSDKLYLADISQEGTVMDGLMVDADLWNSFQGLDTVWLKGSEEVGFLGNIGLQASTVIIDSPLTAAVTSGLSVTVNADEIHLYNSTGSTADIDLYAGRLADLNADANTIYVGYGDTRLSGFDDVSLNAYNNLVFLGEGTLTTGNADLDITSAMVTGSYRTYTDDEGEDVYEALNFQVDSGTGKIEMKRNLEEGSTAQAVVNIGGKLEFTGHSITNSGTISLDSGYLGFKSTGMGDGEGRIVMEDGSVVSVTGTRINGVDYDGGVVFYEAEGAGKVILAERSLTDVSAGSADGDAGTIAISVSEGTHSAGAKLMYEKGTILPDGTVLEEDVYADGDGEFDAPDLPVKGTATNGKGGSFLLDTGSLANASNLIDTLTEGGFDQKIDMRIRKGDVSLARDMTASTFRLSADEGSVNINAIIDASGSLAGGRVEVYAGNNLTLSDGTEIWAMGTGADAQGGEIILGNATKKSGTMDIVGAIFDVTGSSGGTVYLRAPRNEDNNGVNLVMDAAFVGASSVEIEGVMFHDDLDFNDWKSKANDFMTATNGNIDGITLIPGMEYQTAGDLTFDSDLNLTSWRWTSGKGSDAKQVAGAVTFRTTGSLTIAADILDHPTLKNMIHISTADSTSMNFASGASLPSADLFAVENGSGDLTLADGKMVYTESGGINFASGGDTTIGKVAGTVSESRDFMTYNQMNYNLASFSGAIRGQTGGNLVLDSGVIQTATGDIDLDVGKNLELVDNYINGRNYIGSIRTIGQSFNDDTLAAMLWAKKLQTEFTPGYTNGGDIRISAGGDAKITSISGADTANLPKEAWASHEGKEIEIEYREGVPFPLAIDKALNVWSANYGGLSATQGIATMGGGNIDIQSGGSFFAAAGTFGEGSLSLSARGDINGRFLNHKGSLNLESMGSFGMMEGSAGQVVEAFDSQVSIIAQGNVKLGSMVNPTNAGDHYGQDHLWDLQYTQDTSLSLHAATGTVRLTGALDQRLGYNNNPNTERLRILAPNVKIRAGSDIVFENNFFMPPAATGQLELTAGRNIEAADPNQGILMSDMNPSDIYGNHDSSNDQSGFTTQMADLRNAQNHADYILHAADEVNAMIVAGNNIQNIKFQVPKATTLRAGNDIANIRFSGQNLRSTDTTQIAAGRNLYFETEIGATYNNRGIILGGPGLAVVQAGNSIDLGSSLGIQSTGILYNNSLPSGKNDLIVAAGLDEVSSVQSLSEFFLGDSDEMAAVQGYDDFPGFIAGADGLQQAGTKYVQARSSGNQALADQILADAGRVLIDPIFSGSENRDGNVNLVNSRIFSSGGDGSMFVLASGEINVGVSSIKSPPILGGTGNTGTGETSGIYSTSGSPINMFAKDDINVNEARIMTFDGGDITIWSDQGDINAGMGSKVATASSSSYWEKAGDQWVLKYEPPAVGSGIRATSPDIQSAGDIYAFAPSGIIDAGEAGIAGRNVTLAAQQILNAQNIETTGIAIGFTKPSESSAGVSGLSGAGGLADAAMLDEETTGLASNQDRMSEETPEGYSLEPRWVDVEVVGFEEEEQG